MAEIAVGMPDPEGGADGVGENPDEGESKFEIELAGLVVGATAAAGQQKESLLSELLLLLPRFLRFAWRVSRHADVSARWKSRCLIVIAYVISPIDLIPDFVPVIGLIDDLYLALTMIRRALTDLPKPVFDDCWSGGRDVIESIAAGLELADSLLPDNVTEVLDAFFGSAET